MAGEHEFGDGNGPAWLNRRDGDSMDTIGADKAVAQV